MLTVLPERDEKKVKAAFENAGIALKDGGGLVQACENGAVLGYCLYTIENSFVTVHEIIPKDDILLFDGILRSVLFIASQKFVFNAFYDNTLLEKPLTLLGFIKDKDCRQIDMEKLFRGCGCEDKND